MAKLYWTKEVREIVDDEIAKRAKMLVSCDEQYPMEIGELRLCYKFANEILSKMEEIDRLDDEMMEQYRKEREGEKNDADT